MNKLPHNFGLETLTEILSLLERSATTASVQVTERHREDGERYIFTVETSAGEKLVIKCYCNSYNTPEKVSGWAKLAMLYKDNGLHVPLFMKFTNGEYATILERDGKPYLIWVEEYIHTAITDEKVIFQSMNEAFYEALGACLGKMHSATKEKPLKMPWNSPWVLFDTFCEEDEFDENYGNVHDLYHELAQYQEVDQSRLDRIWTKYNANRAVIKENYKHLPNGAVQGDLSINNLIVNETCEFLGVLDFNIAGNDVFINHVMQEGIFLAYFSEAFWSTENELLAMDKNFEIFMNAYLAYYALSSEEKALMKPLYQMIRPFRMEKVYPTIRIAKEGQFDEVNKRLTWIEDEMEKTS